MYLLSVDGNEVYTALLASQYGFPFLTVLLHTLYSDFDKAIKYTEKQRTLIMNRNILKKAYVMTVVTKYNLITNDAM